jgi:hypothetical protein
MNINYLIIIILFFFILLILILFYNHLYKVKNIQVKNNSYPIKNPEELKITRIIKEDIQQEKREDEKIIVEKVHPEITKLKSLLNDFITNDDKWDCLISIGDIYRSGAFPRFLPNEYLATECFKVASMCPNPDVSGLGQLKYIEIRTDSINKEDKGGKPLPNEYGVRICEIALERIKNLPFHLFEKPRMQKPLIARREPVITQTYHNNYHALFNNIDDNYDINIDDINFDINIPINNPINNNTAYKSDSQNVHNHSVVSIAKKNLEEISKEVSSSNFKDPPQKTIEQIKNFILQNEELTDKQSSDALLVISKLSASKNSSFDKSEEDILIDVWHKISNEQNPIIKSNLKETLGKQLASGVEHGHTVCSTGKITRILSTFDGIEDSKLENVRPLWAVKEEIANLASKVREDHLNMLTDVERIAYDRNELQELDKKIKDDFHNQANNIYIKDLKMSDKIIDPIILMYKDAF